MTKKRVLIITYYWPPSGGSGVQRWVYFAKYLKKLGHEPVVLTVESDKATYPSLDKTLEKEIQNIRVIQSSTKEPFGFYKKLLPSKKKNAIKFGEIDTSSFTKKVVAFIRGNFFVPDARKGWKKFAEPAAIQLLREENFDAIITTGPPHSTHLIGLSLKKIFAHIKWIADFRDPWTEIFYNKDLFRLKSTVKKDIKLETSVLNAADNVIAISKHTSELLVKKMDDASKIKIIPNGFEPFETNSSELYQHGEFTFSYVGYLGKYHRKNLLTKGLEQYLKDKEGEFKIHIAGNISNDIIKGWQSIPSLKVQNEGVVSHHVAQNIIHSADIIFISIPISQYSKGNIPGKVLECLSTGKPIALFGEVDSDAAKLVKKAPNTVVLEDDDYTGFTRFVDDVKNGKIRPTNNTDILKDYSRQALTGKLLEVI